MSPCNCTLRTSLKTKKMERLGRTGSSTPSTSMASLKEILNLDKAEWVFQRLLEAVEAHSSELAALRRDVAAKADSNGMARICNEIHDRLAALERRVDATEAAVTLPGNIDLSGSIGEAVAANGQAIRQAMVQLRDKAGKDELAAKSEELEACVRERERAVRKWGVGREFADGLGRVQRGLAEQLSAVQGVLATKLDRAEFDNMEAVCAKVSTVSEFLEETSQRVSKLEAGLDAAELERRQHEAEIEEDLKELQAEIDIKADVQPSQEFARDLAELQKAFSEETLSKRRQLRALKHETVDLQKTVSSLNSSCDERLTTIEACLQGVATKQELAKKADGSDVEKSLRALRDDCTLRAKLSSLSELQSTVSSLETEHAKTRKACDIAARFVDWFSTRGQAYEHNLTAVEKHIENLAIRSVGSRIPPAGAQDGAQRTRVGLRSNGGLGFLGPGGGHETTGGEGGEILGGRRVPYGGNVRFTPS